MKIDVDLKKLKLTIQPHVIARLLSLSDNTDSNFDELDRLVKSDQNMAALILKAANSSLYSRGNEIRTLQHAIAMLGFQIVRSLATMAASRALFEAGNYKRFKTYVWEHSIVTAIISRNLAEKLGHEEHKEEAFIAGLLHDIGKVILNVIDRKKFIEVINLASERKIPFAEAETKIFGFNHLDLGALAVEQWGLPTLYSPILSGHKDLRSRNISNPGDEEHLLLFLVSYGNYLAKKIGFGLYSEKDEDDGAYLEEVLPLSDEDKTYFKEKYADVIANDEFYKFFMTVI